MAADLFISYAWTSGQHQQWVHLLAAQLKALGYDVLVDADVDYGDSLAGFMRRVTEAAHVLLIVDTNYVDRADNFPESGVAVENTWLASVLTDRPSDWLTALFKDNDNSRLPQWLTEHKPKGHWFNADADAGDFPGSEQIEDLWRWVEGLPPNRDKVGQTVVLMNKDGMLSVVEIVGVQRESTGSPYVAPYVDFTWRVIEES